MNNSLFGNILIYFRFTRESPKFEHAQQVSRKIFSVLPKVSDVVYTWCGKNNVSDVLPTWTATQLPHLKYLILWSNNFYDKISTLLCQRSSLEFLNLTDNQIKGNIPSCFRNFSAMVKGIIHFKWLIQNCGRSWNDRWDERIWATLHLYTLVFDSHWFIRDSHYGGSWNDIIWSP